MAKGELIKKLMRRFQLNDREGFIAIAKEIIEDERKMNHKTLAEDLTRIINSRAAHTPKEPSFFKPSPSRANEEEPSLFEIIYPENSLSDVVLTPQNRAKIDRVIRDFLNWEVLTSNGVSPTRRVLFYGPPGCGKTITAEALAAELSLPLFYVRFDAIVSSYLGETAANLRKVFDFAKNDSYVVLFDEFDGIARSRADKYEHGEIKRVVNAFLGQIDNFKGRSLIIAATNFERSLDYAIWRRFDDTVRFEMPSDKERVKLFNLKLCHFKGSEKIILNYVKDMQNFSHYDVVMAARDVIKECVLGGKRIYIKSDIERAVFRQKELTSLRKTWYGTED
jgi:AAA+ superfamily predicted ATPase